MSTELEALGFRPQWREALETSAASQALRIARIERSRAELWSPDAAFELDLVLYPKKYDLAVGDWLLVEIQDDMVLPLCRLPRFSCVSRRAAGDRADEQLIAANLDTLFIVSSCNTDFSLERLERYLVLALDAGVTPVIVLTKADQSDEAEAYVEQARALQTGLNVVALNALDHSAVAALEVWCAAGQTVALVGSSGVGKSTLTNALCLPGEEQDTQAARDGDDKGRHTTTTRSLHRLHCGGLIIDTPGMRELQLPECGDGVQALFEDVTPLLGQCRFNDCAHEAEPGCAIRAAIEAGELDLRRWNSYQKLEREQTINAQGIAERNASQKALSKHYRKVQQHARKRKR